MPEFLLWQALLLEAGVIVVALVALRFKPWQRLLERGESRVIRIAEHTALCICLLAGISVVLRFSFLLLRPVPGPLFHDEFSYLLGADTFVHGCLVNPKPFVPEAFETIHVNLWPTYHSMYLPGPALLLALGKLLGSPWLSIIGTTAAFCASMYWMTLAYLPRTYALVSGLIAVAVTGNLHWWFDNYYVIALSSFATTLVLGSLPRIYRRPAWIATVPLTVGLVLLMLTRPYEGACVALPALLVLLWQLRRTSVGTLLKLAALPCALIAVTTAFLMFGNYRSTGHPLLFPYMLNFRDYHITGPFLWSARQALPHYRLDTLRRFYMFAELPQYDYIRSKPITFFLEKVWIYYYNLLFGFGLFLIPGVAYLWQHRRTGFSLIPLAAFLGFGTNVVLMAWRPFPQYAAPAAPVLLLIVTCGLFQLRHWRWRRFNGVALVRGIVLGELMLWFSLFGLRISYAQDFQEPQYVTKDRNRVADMVLHHPGKQLCLVRYTPGHEAWQEWVFNGADPANERLVWARSLDPETDRRVIEAYPGREVWLVQPDFADDLVRPYVTPEQAGSATGDPPSQRLAVHNVVLENKLPRLENLPQDLLWTAVSSTQVMERASKLQVSEEDATAAWQSAETTLQHAMSLTEAPLPYTPSFFSGSKVSDLNELLRQGQVHAVRVTTEELDVDAPLMLSRNDLTLDLGNTRLRSTRDLTYLVRVAGAHHVRIHGGLLTTGRWGVLVAGSTDVALDGIEFADLDGGGVAVTGSEDVAIRGDKFHGLRFAGVLLQGKTDRVTVLRNIFEQNRGRSNWAASVVLTHREADVATNPSHVLNVDNYGPRAQTIRQSLQPPHDNLIIENQIVQGYSSGIYNDGGVRNIIESNDIEGNSKEGICLDNGATANVVAWNTVRGNGKRWGMTDSDLERDYILLDGRLADRSATSKVPGISLDNAVYNQVVFNTMERNSGGGIKFVRTGFYNIVGLNTLIDNNEGESERFHFFGIELGAAVADAPVQEFDYKPSRGNIVFGNTIRGTHYAGIFFAAGSDRNNVFDNSIFGAKAWAMESVTTQANATMNNLTNLRLRNVPTGLQSSLLQAGPIIDAPRNRKPTR